MPNRRKFLKNAWMVGATGVASSCISSHKSLELARQSYAYMQKRLAFPKLPVSRDRVIKETVGLRPYRVLGPRVEAEWVSGKQLIHNYGHGGSGWSLSWGTSLRAVNLMQDTHTQNIAVLGCGVMGLSTAHILQNKGHKVTIYTGELPPNVTSFKATGTWSPSHYVIEPKHITSSFEQQWKDDCRRSFRKFQDFLGLVDQVEWVDSYRLYKHQQAIQQGPLNISGLLPQAVELAEADHPFKGWKVVKQPRMVFNIPLYLQELKNSFLSRGGTLEIKQFSSLAEVLALPETCAFNCLGLGAHQVFADENLIPVSGQLAFLPPPANFNYFLMTPGAYAVPRKDGIVLGGNHIRGSWDTEPKPEVTTRMVNTLRKVMDEMHFG